MKKNKFIICFFIILLFSSISFGKDKNEMRGIWISDPLSFDWETVITDIKKAGFNNIFVNFASAGVAFYPSKILPVLPPKDSFENLIKVAHKHNISVHAKILAFFMFWSPKAQIEKMKKEGRVLLNTKGKLQLQASTPWLDPSQVKNRKQVTALVKEIIENYDIDGIQLDYVRFYEEKNVPNSITKIRESILTNFVSDLSLTIKSIDQKVRYSACVFWNLHRARNEMAQNWEMWVDSNIFNFLVPMNYTTDPYKLQTWINDQAIIRQGGTTFYSGLGSYMKGMSPEKLLKEINIVRNTNIPGFILFSYNSDFVKTQLPYLIKNIDN